MPVYRVERSIIHLSFPADLRNLTMTTRVISTTKKITFHSGFHHSSADNRLNIDFGADYSYDHTNSATSFGGNTKIFLPPNTPDLINSSGDLVWNYDGVDLSGYQFYSYLKTMSDIENYNSVDHLTINYKLSSDLNVILNSGFSRYNSEQISEDPTSAQSPQYAYSSANFAANNFESINVEPQINYQHNFDKGILTALVGATYKKNIGDNETTQASGYASDALLGSVDGASSIYESSGSTIYKYSALFGRLNYIYDQKFIINLTGRRDGSSNFGPDHQFGNFGSAGLGWLFSEEKFIKSLFSFLSYGKLSGNYGTSGSDAISSYQYQAFWQPVNYAAAFQGTKPFEPVNLYNPDYSWAVKKTLNLALDLGFFNNRLLLNGTYYESREGNQLVQYPLPSQAGFNSVLENLDATVQNKGWEFTLTSNNIKKSNFTWTTNFNISANHNKLVAFPNLQNSSYSYEYYIGKSLSTVTGLRYKDVNPQTGLFEFYTSKGQVTSSPDNDVASNGGDLTTIADLSPKFFGGIGNNFTYKKFSLSIFFQFSKATAPNYLSELYSPYSGYPPGTLTNEPVQVLNHWRNPGDHSGLEKVFTNPNSDAAAAANDFVQSSGAYSDDTYLRLKTVAFSYNLPDNVLKKLSITSGKIFISGENLLTITDYKVGDPEQPGQLEAFPIQRTIVLGTSLNF